MKGINEKDIHIFVDAVSNFFFHATQEKVEIKTAYLLENDVPSSTYDLTSYITLSGSFTGRIYFSAPRTMLTHLLVAMGEQTRDNDRLLDAAGEIANTISGNARKHFGETMEISVPTAQATDPDWLKTVVSPHSYIILVKWKHYRASVVVDIQRADVPLIVPKAEN
ncbi:MAG: chemotaxis protein CheX [Betaproteobacteria bacterium]|jgi:chemotaxis protein CheX|nr:chemotaxis protein CheX [Betaproteobacteria bacterium]